MKSAKVVTVVGARPQFIKAGTVSRALGLAGIDEVIFHTGQHSEFEMSDVFFEELGIPKPAHHLGIAGGSHGAMTGAMLQELEPLLQHEGPNWVLVYGDTNSTLAGALVASKLNIPIAHVEAGLRSFNRRMPEEQNRVVTDHLADILFTPTDTATENLQTEGISAERMRQVGDVMYDAALYYAEEASVRSDVLSRYGIEPRQYVLATVHRAENTDNPKRLRAIIKGLDRASRNLPVILPLHPRTRNAIRREGLTVGELRVTDPVGYLDMVALESNAAVIATDSGGVQKEAYFHKVPCVTLRDETEWVELVELGWNRLASSRTEAITNAINEARGSHGREAMPYGDGKAADRIAEYLATV